jgi:hypothetical protein
LVVAAGVWGALVSDEFTAGGGATGVDGAILEILIENVPQASVLPTVTAPRPTLYESKP